MYMVWDEEGVDVYIGVRTELLNQLMQLKRH